MGSGGTGRPRDYDPSGPADRCADPLPDIPLEEVATSDYYRRVRTVPPRGTGVRLRTELVSGRLGVEVADTGELLGLIPTPYNFLRACIARGYRYDGAVTSSAAGQLPMIRVQLTAQSPR
jgi:hypothetical protein